MRNLTPHITLAFSLACIVGILALAPAAAQQQLPPGHPTMSDQLPPGHPPINNGLPPGHPPINDGLPPGHPTLSGATPPSPPVERTPADPEDVESIDAIISAYYDSISGPAGEERDWNRFRSLFIPEARFIAAHAVAEDQPCVIMPVEQFIKFNAVYFERSGYFEKDVHRHSEYFGSIAHVLSTYESRRALDDEEPYSRGVNSIQLVHDGSRWWITSIMWDFEREDNPIPARHLSSES
jgi:hypothetical protein